MNYKITSSVENSLIPYNKKLIKKDGTLAYEDAVFDIKNKTYDKLPEELKDKFDEYQIETVIHEYCDSSKLSRYIKRYNNHVSMNTDQKAFTYLDRFASRIRKILNSRFFVECSSYSENDKTKGVVERVVVESMMCMHHFDNWKTQAKPACKYLNVHATEEEFDVFAGNIHRLGDIITNDIKDIFNKKDSFIFLTLFDRFTKLGIEDARFAEFLRAFKSKFRSNHRNKNGLLFDEIGKNLSTKDKQVVRDKMDMLCVLMMDFFHIDERSGVDSSVEAFISENVGIDLESVRSDLDFYEESLDALEEITIKDGSKLLEDENRFSLLAMMVYSYKEDEDLEEWLTQYAASNNTYFVNQKQNYLHMKSDFERFLAKGSIKSA